MGSEVVWRWRDGGGGGGVAGGGGRSGWLGGRELRWECVMMGGKGRAKMARREEVGVDGEVKVRRLDGPLLSIFSRPLLVCFVRSSDPSISLMTIH